MDRTEKAEAVSSLNATLSNAAAVVIVRNLGLSVAQSTVLRQQMRDAGASYKVAKNRLAKIALQGTESEGMSDLFKGQTLIAYSNDPITAPKIVMEFAKTNDKLVVLGGSMGSTTLNAEGVKSLATLPSLDELRAKIVGLVQAPATKVAQLSTAPAAKLARVFGAYAKRDAA